MGEKGNVADAAAAVAVSNAGGTGGVVGAVVSGVGGAVGEGATVVTDVVDTTRDKLTEIAADHVIDEGRTRLRGGDGVADEGNTGDEPEAGTAP